VELALADQASAFWSVFLRDKYVIRQVSGTGRERDLFFTVIDASGVQLSVDRVRRNKFVWRSAVRILPGPFEALQISMATLSTRAMSRSERDRFVGEE
jgi:hypothetical protein